MEYIDQAIEAVRTFKPTDATQISALLDKTRQSAATGKFELFKTATRFDATAQHPDWIS